jgi:recombination protein RecA
MPVTRMTRPAAPPPRVFPTGSTLLDLQNGGGWALGRVVNVVGDSSSGKTLLAIEACANFDRLYGVEAIRYVESESAFDQDYALTLGLPPGIAVISDQIHTVEDFGDDLSDFLKRVDGPAALYCLDSADALSSNAEVERKIGTATYGADKAKAFSEIFRRHIAEVGKKNCCLFIISQTRDNIGNMFVPKTRSGGKALRFYASQEVWLHEVQKERRQALGGVERVVGIHVRAQNKKNKISLPFYEIDFLLLFGYGVDDELSMVSWLKKNKADSRDLSEPLERYGLAIRKARDRRDLAVLSEYAGELRAATRARWLEIEEAFKPPIAKYAR